VTMITLSGLLVGYESMRRFFEPQPRGALEQVAGDAGDHADVFTPDACSTSALAVFDDPDCRCSAKFVDLVWDRITSTNRDTRRSSP
jgi:hypothetical protein